MNIAVVRTKRARPASSSDARVVDSLVARDDERPDLPLLGRARSPPFPGAVPGRCDPAAVRRSGEDVERDLARERRRQARLRPDHRRARPATTRSRRSRQPGGRSATSRGGEAQNAPAPPGATCTLSSRPGQDQLSAPWRRAAFSQRSTTGARSTTGLVADDEADLRVPDRGERCPEPVEHRIEVVGDERHRGRAEALADEACERGRVLDGLAAGERDDDGARRLAKPPLRLVERLLDRDLVEAAPANPEQRLADPVAGAEMAEGEAALVAEPAVVHLGVVPREHALRLALADRDPRVAADRAEPADGRHVVDLPGASLEAVGGRQERADRAELRHVPGEVRAVGLVLEGRDQRARTAVLRHELAILRDALGEARAAVAEDAALPVERDRRGDRDRLVEGPLRKDHARLAGAPAEGQVLERALAALVAIGAVERMVQEDELEHGVLAMCCLLARLSGAEHHLVLCSHRAGCLELRHALDLAEAHAARPDGRPEARLVAEDRDLDARRERRLDHARALRHADLAAVDGDRDEVHRHASSCTGTSIWARR